MIENSVVHATFNRNQKLYHLVSSSYPVALGTWLDRNQMKFKTKCVDLSCRTKLENRRDIHTNSWVRNEDRSMVTPMESDELSEQCVTLSTDTSA